MKKVSVPVLIFMMFQSASCMTNAEFGRASSALAEGDKYEVLYRVAPSTYGEHFTTLNNAEIAVTPEGWRNDTDFRNELLDKLFDLTNGANDIKDENVETAIKGVIKDEFPRSEWWKVNDGFESDLIGCVKDMLTLSDKNDIKNYLINLNGWMKLNEDVHMGGYEGGKGEVTHVVDMIEKDVITDPQPLATCLNSFKSALEDVIFNRFKIETGQDDVTKKKEHLDNFLKVLLYRSKSDPNAASDIGDSYSYIIDAFGESIDDDIIKRWLHAAVARQIEGFLRDSYDVHVTAETDELLTKRENMVKDLDKAKVDAALKTAVDDSIHLTLQKVKAVTNALENIKEVIP